VSSAQGLQRSLFSQYNHILKFFLEIINDFVQIETWITLFKVFTGKVFRVVC
jgi:hypothetical protein